MSIIYHGDLAFELFEVAQKKGTIILADGLPGNPISKKESIAEWNRRGYDIVFPRYLGSWESKGRFLEHPPQHDFEILIDALSKGINNVDKVYIAKKIYLLGTSFGGGVIMSIKDDTNIDKICALSPTITYRGIPDINTLASYLQTKYPGSYRFKVSDFDKLLNDEISSPVNKFSLPSSKVMILAGEQDNQISITELRSFATQKSIKLISDPQVGHITLSKLKVEHYDQIDTFFLGQN